MDGEKFLFQGRKNILAQSKSLNREEGMGSSAPEEGLA